MAHSVRLREVLPRDGFQDLDGFIPTETKIGIIETLYGAGLRWIEVTSFVHPGQVPQFQDAAEVVEATTGLAGLDVSVFVPNMRGLERALGTNVHEISLAVATTDELAHANFKRSRDAVLTEALGVAAAARGSGASVSLTIGGAFGCPFQGQVPTSDVDTLVDAAVEAGITTVLVADTIASGDAETVAAMVEALHARHPGVALGVHLHGGVASVPAACAAVAAGAEIVDASLGGYGGCPFVPAAPGNVPTEAVVAALTANGHDCGGLAVPELEAAARQVQATLGGAR